MIPLKDNVPTARFPVVTVVLILINVAVFAWQLSLSNNQPSPQIPSHGFTADQLLSQRDQANVEYGAIPYRIIHPGKSCGLTVTAAGSGAVQPDVVCQGTEAYTRARAANELAPIKQPPWWETLFSSMFMHGGFLHIAFNMLFLWIFGNNVEDAMGRLKFVLFYLLAGLAALFTQSIIDPSSTLPTIGASGAIAGVLGAYVLLHPRARVLSLVIIIFFITLVEVPAWIWLGIWFLLQFLPAIGQAAAPDLSGGGVAYFAHVGGFIFGLLAIKLFAARGTRVGLRAA